MSEISPEELARLARKVDFQDLSLDELNMYLPAKVAISNIRELLDKDPAALEPGPHMIYSREVETEHGKEELSFDVDPTDPAQRTYAENVAKALEVMCEDRKAIQRIPDYMMSLVQKK